MSQAVNATLATRLLAGLSWLSLGGGALTAVTALFCQWAVNAESFGARDMGLALLIAWVGAAALVASLYAAPVLMALGLLSLFVQRRTAFRFFAAGAVTGLPLAVLTLLERASA